MYKNRSIFQSREIIDFTRCCITLKAAVHWCSVEKLFGKFFGKFTEEYPSAVLLW